jgi:transposase-like protein
VRAGRSARSLAQEFGCTDRSIRIWVNQADRDEGRRSDGLTSDERTEFECPTPQGEGARGGERNTLKSRSLVRSGGRANAQAAFEFMRASQGMYGTAIMSRALSVSECGFHAWRKRPPSKRATADAALTTRIRAIHEMSDGTYGAPRIREELADVDGLGVGTKRVARLMRRIGLQGVSGRAFVTTTVRDEKAKPAPDLVDRQFEAMAPNQLWGSDITYVPTWAGFLFLAVVIDVWSRKIEGWAMATYLKTELVITALDMAIAQRQLTGVVAHSDQGC